VSLFLLAASSLRLGKRMFFSPKEALVGSGLSSAERGKGLEANVNAGLLSCFW
jgi:hypothetical protein